ncbi:hypothetical protein F2P81_015434 [Scophthalmus maximus]|uniref:Uncharacterized protein n=1 Tax=Scophthalmus maximus TaxID=52904 RepID=A0A6A4RNC3_SCOMX|nr:hypothetical protein F2P81_026130 [Scophthalmus maximus]KAF0033144.1 hypothetical protein F2P81_015434 [Scophthalmus maximus]
MLELKRFECFCSERKKRRRHRIQMKERSAPVTDPRPRQGREWLRLLQDFTCRRLYRKQTEDDELQRLFGLECESQLFLLMF